MIFGTTGTLIVLQLTHFSAVINVRTNVRDHGYVQQFWVSEEAQDLVEYTLIVAGILVTFFAVLGIFIPNVNFIWSVTNNNLSTAASTATAGMH